MFKHFRNHVFFYYCFGVVITGNLFTMEVKCFRYPVLNLTILIPSKTSKYTLFLLTTGWISFRFCINKKLQQ